MARIVRVIASFLCLGLALTAAPVTATAGPLQYSRTADYRTATTRSTAVAATMTTTTTTRAYAQREAQHPEAADFRGGDSLGIYIGGSAGLVIVVLLVLLLLR